MNKRQVLDKILEKLAENLETLYKAARASHAEATHESSKADNKYDTRGLEAAYLAGGQARQAADVEQTIVQFQKLVLQEFGPKDPIAVGALVEVEAKKQRSFYFIGPRGGGLEVELDGHEIMVVTPHSPLGQTLAGKVAGDKVKMNQSELRIRSVT